MQQCQSILMTDTIKVDDFRNYDEEKRHILPLNVSIRYIIKLVY